MKIFTARFLCLVLLVVSVGSPWRASAASQPAQIKVLPPPTPYAVVGRDGNSRMWQRSVYAKNASGGMVTNVNSFTELATGLHHLVRGQWVESSEKIDILPNGTAAATNGQHQAYFPGDIYQGQIELDTQDGKKLLSRPMGLSYFDGTNIVLIAVLTNSIGQLLGVNQVIYTNAFTGIAADLVYTYTKAGFEQDVVLREQPFTPESYGLNPDTARLQVLTEFFSPPQPSIQSTVGAPQAGLSLTDESLGFGNMQMIQGRAFLLGANAKEAVAGVSKQWVILNGRQFLVEEVPVNAIVDGLITLPEQKAKPVSATVAPTVSEHFTLPPQRLAKNSTKPIKVAKVKLPSQGLVLDYNTINTGQANYTFKGDTTYYISGTVNLSGTTTFEGGAVLKYSNNASLNLGYGNINCQSSAYRPVIFTAKDDNSVGQTITGSTGNPTNYYANPALSYGWLGTGGTYNLSNFRIAWARVAINCVQGSANLFHGQFVNCLTGINRQYGTDYLRNMLFANVQTNFIITYAGENVQNTTFDGSSRLFASGSAGGVYLTNCIMANLACITDSASSVTLVGNHNGFYNSPTFGTSQYASTVYPFQTAGAGNYYLTNGSAFTNAGTPVIDATLLASLQQKTTYPPLFLTNQTVTTDTNLSPQVQRDTSGTPDLGYHYEPIDYIADKFAVSNATVTVTNGAVIASYNETGIQLQGGSTIASIGSPLYPNWFVRYSSVQEQPVSLGGNNVASGLTVGVIRNGNVGPTGKYLFSKFVCPANCGNLFFDSGTNAYSNLLVQNCELWNGSVDFSGNTNTVTTLQNNLFDRANFSAVVGATPTYLSLSNNLIFGTTVAFVNTTYQTTWNAYNNAFDSCTITYSPYVAMLGWLPNGYNCYLNCTGHLSPSNATEVYSSSSLAYQSGPFGNFYQPASSPLLNMGSTTADQVGLYHYTVTTNEVAEGTNIVTIGYHYVAVSANGNPLDTNSNGIPNYLEDANGDGIYDSGDISDWTNFDNDADGLPDWWELKYFGTLAFSGSSPDSHGNTLLSDYQNSFDPNSINFSVSVTNNYVNNMSAPVQLNVFGGTPSYMVVSVDDPNYAADANWQAYTGTNIIVNLGLAEGWHDVWVGLRGLPSDATQTWKWARLKVDLTPPSLVITNPASGTVSVPVIQLQGFANESLSSLTFDVSNAAGMFTNQAGYLTGRFYDANLLDFTTNYFQCYDVALTNGLNAITLHAIDQAGNIATTSVSYTLSYAGIINPPVLAVVWPTDGMPISGTSFTMQGSVSDRTASVMASIVDTNGNTNVVSGLVERSGQVWINNLPLSDGTNTVTVAAMSAAGYTSTATVNVVKKDIGLTIDPLSQPNQSSVTVTGTVSDPSDLVIVNDVQANVDEYGNWSANFVPVNSSGAANLQVHVYDSNANSLAFKTLKQLQPSQVLIASYEEQDQVSNSKNNTCNTSSSASATRTVDWAIGRGGYSQQHSEGSPYSGMHGTCDSYVEWPTNWPNGQNLYGESCDGDYSESPNPAWQYCLVNQTYPYSGDDDCGGTYHAVVTLSRTAETRIELLAGEQAQNGAQQLILLKGSVAEYPSFDAEYAPLGEAAFAWSPFYYGGDTPLPASAISILGQRLTPTANNENVGETLVTMKPGALQDITPVISYPLNQNHYSFDVQPTDVNLQLAVDANRDGNLTFDNADQTSASNPYRFWVNDNQDYVPSNVGLDNAASGNGETVPVVTPDYQNDQIKTIRDLQDFARLNILVQNLTNEIANGTFQIGLKWKNTTGSPAVKLFRNFSPNGDLEYLTDANVAQQFLVLQNPGTVSGTGTYLVPTGFWQDVGINIANNTAYLIFEGCSVGKGQLVLTINKPDGTELAEAGSVWLDIKNIKSMYRRAVTTPSDDSFAPPYNQSGSANYTNGVFDESGVGYSAGTSIAFDKPQDETPQCVVFVHGWNMDYNEYVAFSETMFKRLWWQGYKGRFCTFHWATLTGFTTYNTSEFRAWKYGLSLKNYVESLKDSLSGYSMNIVAHSMGNIVTGSALNRGLTVDNYVLLQAAVPAGCYDTSSEINSYGVFAAAEANHVTPDLAVPDMGYRGFLANVTGNLVNFYNANDFALATGNLATFTHIPFLWWIDANWEANEVDSKPDYFNSQVYKYDSTQTLLQRGQLLIRHVGPSYTVDHYVTDPQEAMSFVARPRSKAVGALADVGGSINRAAQVDLNDKFGFDRARDEHSAEFNWTIQRLDGATGFYHTLLSKLFPPE